MAKSSANFFTQTEAKRILVVDDEAEILQIMEEFLQTSFPKSEIITAENGQEALDLAVKSRFDIICTDHRMPKMSGAVFVNKIRSDSPNKETPILFVTSFVEDAKKIIKYRENIFFLNKPFDSTNLVLYVDSVMLKAAMDSAAQKQEISKLEHQLAAKQERIVQSARVDSYREFSLGIAHELNNPLAVIEGLAYILEEEPEKVKEYSYKIRQSVARMKEVINHLRSFAHLDEPVELSLFDANSLLRDAPAMFFERMKNAGIKFEQKLDKHVLWIKANKLQLERVFQILTLNSIEAYERHPAPGERLIAIKSELQSQQDKHVLISFEDHAGGIPLHLRDKIFDPFITSKNEVTGVGFGLAIAWGVVSNLGGTIEVVDADGGANFLIKLPFAEKPTGSQSNRKVEPVNTPDQSESHDRAAAKTKPKVLIVDDEEAICELLACYLEDEFQVSQTCLPSQALEMAAKETFDLIISDYKMPEMDGICLVNKLASQTGHTNFILISGHILSVDSLDYSSDISSLGFISKPFGDPAAIVDYVKEFLD